MYNWKQTLDGEDAAYDMVRREQSIAPILFLIY
jgi:hypothetical protein